MVFMIMQLNFIYYDYLRRKPLRSGRPLRFTQAAAISPFSPAFAAARRFSEKSACAVSGQTVTVVSSPQASAEDVAAARWVGVGDVFHARGADFSREGEQHVRCRVKAALRGLGFLAPAFEEAVERHHAA